MLLAQSRNPTDYGTTAEFQSYLQTSERLIMNQKTPCVILIDGPVRHQQRAYLNPWLPELNEHVVNIIDSLVHLRNHKN